MEVAAPRLSILIDGGYLFKVFEYYPKEGYRYSCKRLQRKLSLNYNLTKVQYVNSINNRNPTVRAKQEKFYYGFLRDRLGWEVKILPLLFPGGQPKQKGTDALLIGMIHDLAIDENAHTAILLAADSDFVPPVERAVTSGKIIRNAYFSVRPSWHLQQACNGELIRLDDIDFIYKKENPRNLFTLSSLPKIRL